MLIREGSARGVDADRRLACILAAVAGALNTAAFHAVGFFSANMTGNVSLSSNHLSSGHFLTGTFFLVIVFAFVFGAFFSTLVVDLGKRQRIPGMYVFSILAEAVLLGALGIAEFWLSDDIRGPTLVLGLSFLMGLQNAIVTQISDARVRTTHISGMSTDIGIGLGKLLNLAGRKNTDIAASGGKARLRLHAETILSFFLGGALGVFVYDYLGYSVVLVASGVLFLLAGSGLLRLRSAGRPAA